MLGLKRYTFYIQNPKNNGLPLLNIFLKSALKVLKEWMHAQGSGISFKTFVRRFQLLLRGNNCSPVNNLRNICILMLQ